MLRCLHGDRTCVNGGATWKPPACPTAGFMNTLGAETTCVLSRVAADRHRLRGPSCRSGLGVPAVLTDSVLRPTSTVKSWIGCRWPGSAQQDPGSAGDVADVVVRLVGVRGCSTPACSQPTALSSGWFDFQPLPSSCACRAGSVRSILTAWSCRATRRCPPCRGRGTKRLSSPRRDVERRRIRRRTGGLAPRLGEADRVIPLCWGAQGRPAPLRVVPAGAVRDRTSR